MLAGAIRYYHTKRRDNHYLIGRKPYLYINRRTFYYLQEECPNELILNKDNSYNIRFFQIIITPDIEDFEFKVMIEI